MTRSKVRSVVLLSGGLDSAANLALAAHLDEPVLALTFRYGQRAADREAYAASRLARYYQVRHEVVDLPWLGDLGGSALTQLSIQLPELETDQLDRLDVTQKSAKSVWVPNRNGVLINVAAAFAERLGAKRIVVGFNREEAATFPDNTEDFLKAASGALKFSAANEAEVHCYTTTLDKREIVIKIKALEAPFFPFELIWSCYQGTETPCETCESCRRLKRALDAGGVKP